MNLADAPVRAQRVLLLLGTARDTQLAGELLARSGIASHACPSASQLRLDIEAGVGAVLIAEEALDVGGHDALLRTLEAQPAWSDLPILVLARPGADSTTVGDAIAALGNVTLLERPLRVAALVSVVRTALRARARQYQIEANLKSLEQARDAEALAARRKDEFLAMLAHELRNPLAPIRSALFLLGQDAGEAEGQRQLRQMMERQVDHLVRLVDDLLEGSRLSRGKIELQRQPLDLKQALLRAVELSRPQIDAAGCTLDLDLDPRPLPLDADPIRIAQVFGNLLNNAARYGRFGGRIRLEARRTRGGEVRVRVADDGIGIDAETLPHVFELFTQGARDADSPRGGLGIGLALVRALVEQHGGRVAAASAGRGRGAEFSVWLPLAARAREAAASPEAVSPAPATAGLRVLVVDDNRDAARTLALVLGTLGIEHVSVHDGASALAAADALSPDAVLLDLGMPGMDGYEVARRLRADPRHAHTLLVALTGWSGAHDQVRSREAGFDHHLRKPADVNTLVRLLAAVAPAHAGAPCAGSPPPLSTPLTVR